uniref:Uncharacterized protein n=1 Tax=Cyanothece sp. (strain PCC 7425 / ATCC 29141) TaxID=395961 RepID=B8HYX8_CYAP4
MTNAAPAQVLDQLRGNLPPQSLNVRSLAQFSEISNCNVAGLGMAAGVNFSTLLKGTPFTRTYTQSPFAFMRGNQFEKRLTDNNCQSLLSLCQQHLNFLPQDNQVIDLRAQFPSSYQSLWPRAQRTRQLVQQILQGQSQAPNLIIGAVFAYSLGGQNVYFEADLLGANHQQILRPIEVKSFPILDERAIDPRSLGAAFDQAAVYILMVRELVSSLGGNLSLVPGEAVLINPFNATSQPHLSCQSITQRINQAQQRLNQVQNLSPILSNLPANLSFATIADRQRPIQDRLQTLDTLTQQVGTCYTPSCQRACGLANYCRHHAHNQGLTTVSGQVVQHQLPGVTTLNRAAALAGGALPNTQEQAIASQLQRAEQLYNQLSA